MIPFAFLGAFFNVKKILSGISGGAGFIVQNWKVVIFIFLLTVVVYQNFFNSRIFWFDTLPALRNDIALLEKKVEEAEANLKTCADGNEKLSQAIEKQNEKIKQLKEISDKLAKQRTELELKIGELRKKTNQSVQGILSKPTPKTCEDAIKFLIDESGNLKW